MKATAGGYSRNSRSLTASPAEPGELPFGLGWGGAELVVHRAEGVDGETWFAEVGSVGGVKGEDLALGVDLRIGCGDATDAVGRAAGPGVERRDEVEDAHKAGIREQGVAPTTTNIGLSPLRDGR
jgi:hypothetical protein